MAQRKHQVTAEMQDLDKAYTEHGISGIAEKIAALDLLYEYSSLLLAQVAPDMMHAMLDNTLVEKVNAGTIKLNDWNCIPRATSGDREPSIYVNYFTKPDGSGLATDEFETYILAMEATLRGKKITIAGQTIDIVKEVDDYFQQISGEKTGFSDKSTFKNAFKVDLPKFSSSARKLLAQAKQDGCTEIRFHGEVGWSIETDTRVKTHHKLLGSAVFFRLTVCVVNVLWPQYNFKMYSYCMFRVAIWIHAEIGESIGSHLISSYYTYGGLNYKTAGVSVSSAVASNAKLWQQVSKQYKDCLDFAQAALEQDGIEWEQKREAAKAKHSAIIKTKKLEELSAKLEIEEAEAVKSGKELGVALKKSQKETKSLRKVVDSKEAETKDIYDALDQLARDFDLIEVAAPLRQPFRDIYMSSSVPASAAPSVRGAGSEGRAGGEGGGDDDDDDEGSIE
ncbi:hypothetical protein KCU98_g1496, partial [Aureobasidium melanogenum]